MNARTIRRAAERKAAKLASKVEKATTDNFMMTQDSNRISPAQQAANQSNAQFSTGPRTEAGKQTSSRNALKTGLTGQTVLLPADDLAAYEALLTRFAEKYNPVTPEEEALVQSVVDTTWRLQRIVPLEFAIYAKGAIEFAEQFAEKFDDLDAATRTAMIRVETYLKYEKLLRNLTTQEGRLQRQLKKDTAALQQIQEERCQQEAAIKAAQARVAAKSQRPQPTQPENGFEFSTGQNDCADGSEPGPDELATAA